VDSGAPRGGRYAIFGAYPGKDQDINLQLAHRADEVASAVI